MRLQSELKSHCPHTGVQNSQAFTSIVKDLCLPWGCKAKDKCQVLATTRQKHNSKGSKLHLCHRFFVS